jgi:hypothetical protein
VVPLSDEAMDQLPPFHPGCRCGVLPDSTDGNGTTT